MPTWSDFFGGFDWSSLLTFLFTAVAALLCITVHELAHGASAYLLGDPTAKRAGRLTFNPLRHLDFLGLLMLVTVHVGWAKPVPIDLRRFRRPRLGMAITAMAGPLSNFLISFLALLAGRIIYYHGMEHNWAFYGILGLLYLAVLSLGLGVFNLIPIPPLDGSKILLSFLPARISMKIMRVERYIAVVMVALVWLGVFSAPLDFLREWLLEKLCLLSGFPFDVAALFFS